MGPQNHSILQVDKMPSASKMQTQFYEKQDALNNQSAWDFKWDFKANLSRLGVPNSAILILRASKEQALPLPPLPLPLGRGVNRVFFQKTIEFSYYRKPIDKK